MRAWRRDEAVAETEEEWEPWWWRSGVPRCPANMVSESQRCGSHVLKGRIPHRSHHRVYILEGVGKPHKISVGVTMVRTRMSVFTGIDLTVG